MAKFDFEFAYGASRVGSFDDFWDEAREEERFKKREQALDLKDKFDARRLPTDSPTTFRLTAQEFRDAIALISKGSFVGNFVVAGLAAKEFARLGELKSRDGRVVFIKIPA